MTATEAPVADPAPLLAALLVGAFTALAAQHPPHPAPRCRRPCGAPARSPSRQCRRAQVHICGPDDPTLDRVAVVDGV